MTRNDAQTILDLLLSAYHDTDPARAATALAYADDAIAQQIETYGRKEHNAILLCHAFAMMANTVANANGNKNRLAHAFGVGGAMEEALALFPTRA